MYKCALLQLLLSPVDAHWPEPDSGKTGSQSLYRADYFIYAVVYVH